MFLIRKPTPSPFLCCLFFPFHSYPVIVTSLLTVRCISVIAATWVLWECIADVKIGYFTRYTSGINDRSFSFLSVSTLLVLLPLLVVRLLCFWLVHCSSQSLTVLHGWVLPSLRFSIPLADLLRFAWCMWLGVLVHLGLVGVGTSGACCVVVAVVCGSLAVVGGDIAVGIAIVVIMGNPPSLPSSLKEVVKFVDDGSVGYIWGVFAASVVVPYGGCDICVSGACLLRIGPYCDSSFGWVGCGSGKWNDGVLGLFCAHCLG